MAGLKRACAADARVPASAASRCRSVTRRVSRATTVPGSWPCTSRVIAASPASGASSAHLPSSSPATDSEAIARAHVEEHEHLFAGHKLRLAADDQRDLTDHAAQLFDHDAGRRTRQAPGLHHVERDVGVNGVGGSVPSRLGGHDPSVYRRCARTRQVFVADRAQRRVRIRDKNDQRSERRHERARRPDRRPRHSESAVQAGCRGLLRGLARKCSPAARPRARRRPTPTRS